VPAVSVVAVPLMDVPVIVPVDGVTTEMVGYDQPYTYGPVVAVVILAAKVILLPAHKVAGGVAVAVTTGVAAATTDPVDAEA